VVTTRADFSRERARLGGRHGGHPYDRDARLARLTQTNRGHAGCSKSSRSWSISRMEGWHAARRRLWSAF